MCSVMQTRNPFRYRSGDLGCHNQLISMRLHSLSHCKLLMIFIGLIKRNHGANSSAATEEWHRQSLPCSSSRKLTPPHPFAGVALLPCSRSRDVITSHHQPQTASWQVAGRGQKTIQHRSYLGEKHVELALLYVPSGPKQMPEPEPH